MIETLTQLYEHAGAWGNPILLASAALFLVGSIMLFTARLIKRFVYLAILSLIVPNSIGVIGTIQEASDVKEALTERGKEITEEVRESVADFKFSPLYLSLLGSGVTILLAAAGIAKSRMSKPTATPDKPAKP